MKAEQITKQIREFLKNESSNTLEIYREAGAIKLDLESLKNNKLKPVEEEEDNNDMMLEETEEEEQRLNFGLSKKDEKKKELEQMKSEIENF